MESVFDHLGEHLTLFFAGATGIGILSHAVNTFPVPENKYGKWLLGTLQYVVGQRAQAQATMNGGSQAK